MRKAALSLGADFAHLYEVAHTALSHGDRRPAEVLWHSYKKEAVGSPKDVGGRGDNSRHSREIAKKKAQAIARLLAKHRIRVENLPTSDPPTPATAVRARKRRNPLANIKLSDEQARAAEEIKMIYEATVAAVLPGGRPLDFVKVDVSPRVRDLTRGIGERLADIRHRLYLPWCEEYAYVAAEKKVGGMTADRILASELVLDVLVNERSFGSFERRFGRNHKYFSQVFRTALDGYAKRARAHRRTTRQSNG